MARGRENGRRWVSVGELQDLLGLSRTAVQNVRAALGNSHEKQDGRRVLVYAPDWLRDWAQHTAGLPPGRTGQLTEDDVLLAGASQDLKDEFLRERIRERRLINRERSMELAHLEESHIPTERVSQFAMGLAEVARKRCEDEQGRFENKFGRDAAKMVAQMFEDFADAALKRFENEFGDTDECDSDSAA
ncbi:MAG: hypothetical protein AAGJ46_14380 [Planctomycetota bacterium]